MDIKVLQVGAGSSEGLGGLGPPVTGKGNHQTGLQFGVSPVC